VKRIYFLCFLLFFLFGVIFFFPQNSAKKVFAEDNSDVTLSDAIYADLAVRNYLDNVSVVLKDNNSSNNVTINEKRYWVPASTVKLFAGMYAYKLIAEKKLHVDDQITIEGKNVVPTELVSDELPALQEGDSVSVERLIKQMLTQSDNTAFNMLLDVLDRQKITQYIRDIGLTHSAVGSKLNLDTSQEQYEFDVPGYGINTTTAEDYAQAFTYIKERKILGAADLFNILLQQKINTMIPLLLPKDVQVAHKTGDLDPLYHDGGIIIKGNNSYVLSVFTNTGDPNIVAHISDLVYTKNYNLVGAAIQGKPLSMDTFSNQTLDPLLLQPNIPRTVLGAQTKAFFQTPSITAADLGITANDLSVAVSKKDLPKVIISADSPWHFLIPAWQQVKDAFTLEPKARAEIALDGLTRQLAESKDLQTRGNTRLANNILQQMQTTLIVKAKEKVIASDAKEQSTIQTISETRFGLLADELKSANPEEKKLLIKEIAQQAKSTLANIQPFIPKAINATNPTQKPLIGEVIENTKTALTVKTAGGQQLTIPTENQEIKVREKKTLPLPPAEVNVSSIQPGTTVALVGSSTNNTFTPSFILTNLPKELAAPEPVTVLKINQKNHTMIVSENDVPVQVDITQKTPIKGADTNVSLKEIKPGDTVVVHGQPIQTSIPTQILTPTIPLLKSGVSHSQTIISPPKTVTTPVLIPTSSVIQQKNTVSQKSNPPVIQQQTVAPKVIQSTTIQVVEKKEDSKPKDVSKPQTQQQQPKQESKSENQPKPQPQSHTSTTSISQTSGKSDDKNKKK